MHKVSYAYKFRSRDTIPDNNKRSCRSLSKMYMQTCCTHRIYNHSVVNVCGISGELQVSNNENVFKQRAKSDNCICQTVRCLTHIASIIHINFEHYHGSSDY